jgi:glycosyltransferase involved in cell wall biosynthesis
MGTHLLLVALTRLERPDAELWLIGGVEDEMRPALARYEGLFELKGFVPHAQLPALLTQCSVYVQPSLEEGLAKVLLEAMASGLPVVATTNTGAEDVVREGVDGFVVPIRDPEALAERLTRLADDEEARRRMGASAAERVARGFSWKDYADRMRAVLRQAAP